MRYWARLVSWYSSTSTCVQSARYQASASAEVSRSRTTSSNRSSKSTPPAARSLSSYER